MNVFQKCLRRQMGSNKYIWYVEVCKKNFAKNNITKLSLESKPIFDDIYDELKKENKSKITERMKDMLETLSMAFRITKYFSLVFLFYIISNIVLLMLDLNYYVTCISILMMGVCFIYKVVEFVSNKYCVLDAYLFMIYKSALEKRAKE